MEINTGLESLLQKNDLSIEDAKTLILRIGRNELDPIVSTAFLLALRSKGESAEELAGFSEGMRELSLDSKISNFEKTVDIVGTGGDGSHSLNLSTGSALLAAASGLKVIKHGNRSISSKSGSADVLAKIGFPIELASNQNEDMLNDLGFTFLFAPNYHPAMKYIAPIRKALGIRTIFNMLGPLVNPYPVSHYVMGAFSLSAAELMAKALKNLSVKKAVVIHGSNGWDEATPASSFHIFYVSPEEPIHSEIIDPSSLGLEPCSEEELSGGDAEENAKRLIAALHGNDSSAHRNALCLGSGLALFITDECKSIKEGIELSKATIESGKASNLIEKIQNKNV